MKQNRLQTDATVTMSSCVPDHPPRLGTLTHGGTQLQCSMGHIKSISASLGRLQKNKELGAGVTQF